MGRRLATGHTHHDLRVPADGVAAAIGLRLNNPYNCDGDDDDNTADESSSSSSSDGREKGNVLWLLWNVP